jgi:hypothetical protein
MSPELKICARLAVLRLMQTQAQYGVIYITETIGKSVHHKSS